MPLRRKHLHRHGLVLVVERGRCAVCVDVADFVRAASPLCEWRFSWRAPRPLPPEPAVLCDSRLPWSRSRQFLLSFRARSMADCKVSIMSTAAPSPITKPSLSASKGREAASGSSLRVDSAWQALKPATLSGILQPRSLRQGLHRHRLPARLPAPAQWNLRRWNRLRR